MNKFKTDNFTRWIGKGLFLEFRRYDTEDLNLCLYTLKDEDHELYPSLYRLYMEMEDIHEAEFSKKYLGGYKHWKWLCNQDWFLPYVREWREELELLMMSRALRSIKEASLDSNNKVNLQASKYILDRTWDKNLVVTTPSREKARPTLDKLRDQVSQNTIQEDYKRLLT
jgi:hypothetical protein